MADFTTFYDKAYVSLFHHTTITLRLGECGLKMFNKKPRRNFRQRRGDSSDEEEKQKDVGQGEESENTEVTINKPIKINQGRGISCSSKREKTPPKPESSDEEDAERLEVTSEGEEAVKEKGGRKKANTVLSFPDDGEALEPEFKLNKSSDKAVVFQAKKKGLPPSRTTHNIESSSRRLLSNPSPKRDHASSYSLHDDDEDKEEDDDDDDDDDDDNNDDDESDCEDDSRSSSSSCSYPAAKPVVIPTAKEIEAARRQRRNTRAQKEYISLNKDGLSSADSTPNRYSRDEDEERVDDDDDDPDDHERRIEFAPRLKSIRERIAEKLGSDGSLSGTEEEQELWEETQIGKGVKRRPGEMSPYDSDASSYSSYSSNSNSNRHDQQRRQKKKSTGVKIASELPSITVAMVKRRIPAKLDMLKEVYRAHLARHRLMQGDLENAKCSAMTLEETSSERQLKFYRSMTLFTHNLVECLREKVIEINSFELEMHTLLSGQSEELLAPRQQMVKEQAERLQQLSYGHDEQKRTSDNGTQSQSEAVTDVKDEGEFDVPEDTQPSLEQEQHLQKQIDDILLRSQAVFADVQEEFRDVKKILSHFEEWREFHSESYHNAYISLCLPKLLNPFIRHQLLAWNPLKDSCGDFENLPWFTALETFCHGHGHEELEHADRETLSNVVERTVIPKLSAFVELVWDPMSRSQSVCLTDICHRLQEDYSIFEGEQSKPVKMFIEAALRRLRNCVDEDIFIPLYPKKFLDDKSSPQTCFRDQQFWTAIKVLGNIGKWDMLLPEPVLKELMLDKLLSRYLMVTLCSQTVSHCDIPACKKIADSLPLSWFKGETACLPQLQLFRNHLVQKVNIICKHQAPQDANTRVAVVDVLQILSRIRCHDSIMTLAQKYHYEDAIYSHQLLNQDIG